MSKRMWIVLIACAIVFGGIFGFKWFVSQKIAEYLDHMPVPAATVTTTEAKKANWAQTLTAVGTVKAVNGIAVTSRAAGYVSKINFQSGDSVNKGDVLLRLESQEDKATLASLQAAAKLAVQNFKRYKRLYKKGSVSKSQLDQARSQRNQAAAQAKAQKARLEYKTIRAPFAGELGIRQVDQGQYVQPGTTLVMLQSLSPIYIDFSLPEQDLSVITKGLKVKATLDSQPDKPMLGKISAADPGVDASTRNFNIQARFDNKEHKLRPGMFASITIQLKQSKDVVVIPQTAVKYNPYGDAVFIIDKTKGKDGKEQTIVHSRFVKLGEARGDVISVLKGLEPGDEIATSGLLKLHNNGVVKIDNSVQPPADLNPHPANS